MALDGLQNPLVMQRPGFVDQLLKSGLDIKDSARTDMTRLTQQLNSFRIVATADMTKLSSELDEEVANFEHKWGLKPLVKSTPQGTRVILQKKPKKQNSAVWSNIAALAESNGSAGNGALQQQQKQIQQQKQQKQQQKQRALGAKKSRRSGGREP